MQREEVIRQIVAREEQGHDLTEEAVLREAAALHSAACDRFGAWETALRYAGVALRFLSAPTGYNRTEVLRRIRHLCRKGCRLQATDIMRRERALHIAAVKHFGSWRRGLEAAGIHVENLVARGRPPRRLNREKTLNALRAWLATTDAATWLDLCLRNHSLAMAVKRACGSWREALLAVGRGGDSGCPRRQRKWTAQRVIEVIQTRHREGKPLRRAAVVLEDQALTCAGRRYFGTWGNALAAAGLDAPPSTQRVATSGSRKPVTAPSTPRRRRAASRKGATRCRAKT